MRTSFDHSSEAQLVRTAEKRSRDVWHVAASLFCKSPDLDKDGLFF